MVPAPFKFKLPVDPLMGQEMVAVILAATLMLALAVPRDTPPEPELWMVPLALAVIGVPPDKESVKLPVSMT